MGFFENRKLRKERNITDEDVERFNMDEGWDNLKTIKDIEIVLLFGREFEVKYKEYTALITTSFGSGFSVFSTRHGDQEEKFVFDTDDLDDFAEHATLGPYLLKDIVGKWEITWHA